MPKLTYLLRRSLTFNHPDLHADFDDCLKYSATDICNASFDNISWNQSTLPIRLDDIGLRRHSTYYMVGFHFSKPVFDIWNCTVCQLSSCPGFTYWCVVINKPTTTRKFLSPASVGRHQIIFSLRYFETPAWPAPTGMSLFGNTTQFWSMD